MNKKAFTLVEMLAVVLILGVIMAIATISYSKHLNTSRQKSFEIAENSFHDTLEEAYVDCSANFTKNDFCNRHNKPKASDKIYLSELINNGYIENIKDPYSTEKNCDINSYIEITGIDSNDGIESYSYNICLMCSNQTSEGCNN